MVLCFLLDAVSELLGENYKNMSLNYVSGSCRSRSTSARRCLPALSTGRGRLSSRRRETGRSSRRYTVSSLDEILLIDQKA